MWNVAIIEDKEALPESVSVRPSAVAPAPTPSYTIVVCFGDMDGKKQIHKTTIQRGKANRSALQQATLEAESKWNEKHNREGYQPRDAKADAKAILKSNETRDTETISAHPPPFFPMLAATFNKNLYTTFSGNGSSGKAYKMPFPAFIQRKIDGIRCICSYRRLPSPRICLSSRKNVEFIFFEAIKTQLLSLYEIFDDPESIILDGELYTDDLSFETISGCVRLTKNRQKPEDTANMDKMEFHVYDMFDARSPLEPFWKRTKQLDYYFQKWMMIERLFREPQARVDGQTNAQSPKLRIRKVETETADDLSEILVKHNQYVQEGFEGIMIRDSNGVYEPNKRSRYLQKYKEFMEEEFEIVGFHSGTGIDEGAVIWNCCTHEGQPFSVRPRLSIEERRILLQRAEDYVGKKLTVIFQEYSTEGIPRFPVGKGIRVDL